LNIAPSGRAPRKHPFVDSNVFLADLALNGRLLGRCLFRGDNLARLDDSFFNYRLFLMELNRVLLLRECFALVGALGSAARRLSIDTDRLAAELYRLVHCFGLYNLSYGDGAGIHFTFSDSHIFLVKGNGHRTA
jgi:hypothetical protein